MLELILEDAQQVLRPEEVRHMPLLPAGLLRVMMCDLLELCWAQSVANALGPMVTCTFPTHKQRFTFLLAHRNVGSLLEVAKVADVLVGVVDTQSADGGWLDEVRVMLLEYLLFLLLWIWLVCAMSGVVHTSVLIAGAPIICSWCLGYNAENTETVLHEVAERWPSQLLLVDGHPSFVRHPTRHFFS